MLHHAYRFAEYQAPRLSEPRPAPFTKVLGLHLNGHDASAAIVEDGRLTDLIELERVFREKHFRLNVLHPRFDRVIDWLFNDYKLPRDFDAVALHLHYFGSEPREHHYLVQDRAVEKLSEYLPDAHYLQLNHHLCHAAASYYSSPWADATILSIDGHGNDGSSLGFVGRAGQLDYVKGWPFSLGRAYSALGNIIGGIQADAGDVAGKVMGLTAYGTVIDDWIEPIEKFILGYTGIRSEYSPLSWEAGVADGVFVLPRFGTIHGKAAFKGPEDPEAQNFAASYQVAWSNVVQNMVGELIDATQIANLCMTGGAALNGSTNYDVSNMDAVTGLHLIPHPSDVGIAAGAALYTYYSYQGVEWKGAAEPLNPYLGVPILDLDRLETFAVERSASQPADLAAEVARRLADGQVVALMQGASEIGPRALGNRSILCDARDAGMKDFINNRVKRREWYRPVAPVVQVEKFRQIFTSDIETPYMSMICEVHDEYREQIPAAIHVDGTARVQTLRRDINPLLWQILEEFEKITGVGVLINTSFNGAGEPVVARISEALSALDSTELDAIVIEGYLFDSAESASPQP